MDLLTPELPCAAANLAHNVRAKEKHHVLSIKRKSQGTNSPSTIEQFGFFPPYLYSQPMANIFNLQIFLQFLIHLYLCRLETCLITNLVDIIFW